MEGQQCDKRSGGPFFRRFFFFFEEIEIGWAECVNRLTPRTKTPALKGRLDDQERLLAIKHQIIIIQFSLGFY